MVVTEATPGYEPGELYQLTAGWRQMAGHKIYCFNASDLTSHRINPIDRVRRAPEEMKAQLAEKLADLVILNGELHILVKMAGDSHRKWPVIFCSRCPTFSFNLAACQVLL